MFKKTLWQLTALNSTVFLLIFIVLGATLYAYVNHQLFDDVDDSMQNKVEAFQIVNGRPRMVITQAVSFDPRTFLLLRDSNDNIINLNPLAFDDVEQVPGLLDGLRSGAPQSRKLANHVYRIVIRPYVYAENTLIRPDAAPAAISEIIAVSIVDSEVAMLRRLFFVLMASLFAGTLAITFASYYLANRALIPIKAAWDKQQQFTADASHELRTPLAVIKSNAELLLRHPEHSVEQESIRITNILRETIRMNKLVTTLLTLTRADANQIDLRFAALNLSDLIHSLVGQFRPLAEIKKIELLSTVQPSLKILADEERIYQMLVIVLDNALKYTNRQGKVQLLCYGQANSVVIQIEDTGCGIAAADMPHIFDRFFRGDKARSRETGGSGLGLAIAQWIVEKHNGKIQVESRIGMGTKFSIILPIK
ncbi:MAG: HAMP domain-containing sensor histidine kinase [Veillonellales bacterium]